MTHLPYILASYGIFAVVAIVLALCAQVRLAKASRRLRDIDPRSREGQA
jgi:hypothetical protein